MILRPGFRRRLVVLVGLVVSVYYVIPSLWDSLHPFSDNQEEFPDDTTDVYNRTLGFQKVFAIGFVERTDKRDAITVASSITGFDVDWSPGVQFADVPLKAAPSTWDYEEREEGALGCWRAHMNVLEKIVREGIQSALILEDDVDWDVSLKNQLWELAHAARLLTPPLSGTPQTSDTIGPYGDGWDLLWIGTCWTRANRKHPTTYIVHDDPTVPAPRHRFGRWQAYNVADQVKRLTRARMYFKSESSVCAYAYAVTYASARKLLSQISLLSRNQPVDVAFRDICLNKTIGTGTGASAGAKDASAGAAGEASPLSFNCISVYPTLFSSHRFAGNAARDSDIRYKGTKWHGEFTQDIKFSTIQNRERLMSGLRPVSQWPLTPEDEDEEEVEEEEAEEEDEEELGERGLRTDKPGKKRTTKGVQRTVRLASGTGNGKGERRELGPDVNTEYALQGRMEDWIYPAPDELETIPFINDVQTTPKQNG